MTVSPGSLYEALAVQPSAPDEGFSWFVVGDDIAKGNYVVHSKIVTIARHEAPSQMLMVTGTNGNGKTLLNNMIKEHLSTLNENHSSSGDRIGCKFDYFFTHVKVHGLEASRMGADIVSHLQVHNSIEPTLTYSLISLKVFQNFLQTYKLPFYVKCVTNPFKWGIKAAASLLDRFVGGMISDFIGEATGDAFDEVNKTVQDRLAVRHTAARFREYCQGKMLGTILADSYSKNNTYTSAVQFNRSVFDAFARAQILNNVNDAIRATRDIIGAVSAKVLVVLVDDANDEMLLENFAGFIDGLDELDRTAGRNNPRVLLILNMVKFTYDSILHTDKLDKSLQQRLCYNEPVFLPGPSQNNLRLLVEKLVNLRNGDPSKTPITITDQKKQEIAENCKRDSYRESTSCILKCLSLENRRDRMSS